MEKLIGQIARFGVVGVVATVIDYGLLMILSQLLGWNPVFSAALSFCASLIFNYIASMRFVFTRRDDLSRRQEFATFCVLSAIGLALNELIMAMGTILFGSSALVVTLTKAVATLVVMIWNFVSRKRWLDADGAL